MGSLCIFFQERWCSRGNIWWNTGRVNIGHAGDEHLHGITTFLMRHENDDWMREWNIRPYSHALPPHPTPTPLSVKGSSTPSVETKPRLPGGKKTPLVTTPRRSKRLGREITDCTWHPAGGSRGEDLLRGPSCSSPPHLQAGWHRLGGGGEAPRKAASSTARPDRQSTARWQWLKKTNSGRGKPGTKRSRNAKTKTKPRGKGGGGGSWWG